MEYFAVVAGLDHSLGVEAVGFKLVDLQGETGVRTVLVKLRGRYRIRQSGNRANVRVRRSRQRKPRGS